MKIFLMQQTHTDIGYTERQEKITDYHVDYLKQAIMISEGLLEHHHKFKGYVWNNESFWIIDQFIKRTDQTWHQRLIDAAHRGHIQITSNYLNMTDLVNDTVLRHFLNQAKAFGEKHHIRVDAAISMDVNGWSEGYLNALLDAGVKHFYTCVHNHHGLVPFQKVHYPFYWQHKDGRKLLIWHGDHYAEGNAAGIHPKLRGFFENKQHQIDVHITHESLKHIKDFLDDYMVSMKNEAYPFDFLPLMSLGLFVDNAPPNPFVIQVIEAFNEQYKDIYEIEMIGIHQFFDYIESLSLSLPTHHGDWNDWWSDGYMSTPQSVSDYKEAERNFNTLNHLYEKGYPVSKDKLDALAYQLMMFAEHTWGYFTSVSEPWNKMTKKLQSRKELFASRANELSDMMMDDFKVSQDEFLKSAGRPLHFEVFNPYPIKMKQKAVFYIAWWESHDIEKGYEILHVESNTIIEHQEIRVDERARREVHVYVELEPYEKALLYVLPKETRKPYASIDPLQTHDTHYDFKSPYLNQDMYIDSYGIETNFYKILWSQKEGIHTFFDKALDKNLINKNQTYGLLTPIYEVSEVEYTYKFNVPEMRQIRADYGRHRHTFSTLRDIGKLVNVKIIEKGSILGRVQLKYKVKGTRYAVIELTCYKYEPRLDVSFILQKDTVWEPESMYLNMPFTMDSSETLMLDKAGVAMRPRIDQLPFSQALFYTTQSGYALFSKHRSILVALKDTPLIHLGTLDTNRIVYHDGTYKNADDLYIWVMNNYWETNFATHLGGFYQFEYIIKLSEPKDSLEAYKEEVSALTKPFITYQVKK